MEKAKKIVKQFIPPIILSLLRSSKIKKVEPPNNENWLGDFSTWEDAKKQCGGYESEIILEKCKKALLKVKNGEAVYERDSVLFDQIQYNRGLLEGLQKVALDNENNLCVLDFGGSLGSTYFQNKAFLSSLKTLEWNIVEQSHFIACGKENFENDQLKFYHTIQECLKNKKPDVILLSSVIQYMEKPFELLEHVNQLGINYIIFDRTSFIDQPDNLLMIQKVPAEIYEASYPIWFFNMDKIITSLSNYTLLTTFDCASDNDELIKDKIMASWKGLIFIKK